jgi:hypothetical protein
MNIICHYCSDLREECFNFSKMGYVRGRISTGNGRASYEVWVDGNNNSIRTGKR